MLRRVITIATVAALAILALGSTAVAQVKFEDPTGDDNGPGAYVYPTDAVYTRGSFDLTGFSLDVKGKKGNVDVTVNSNLEDPWGMDIGFAVQMVFVFIDNAEGGSGTACRASTSNSRKTAPGTR